MKALIAMLMLTLGAVPAAAQTIRTSIKPESGVVLGQHVRVLVDVLFPDDMPRPPRVSFAEMPGAQMVRYETQATTMSDRIDGKAYVGQRFEFALYPRRGGTLSIPAPEVTVLDRAGEVTGQVAGTPTRIDVSVPAGVDPSKPLVATTALTLEQRWQPDPAATYKAGDAVVRTITREARDVPGMAMLDLALAAPDGVRVYVDPPQTEDRVERGDLTGRRIDRITYVFERGGSFPIEAVGQPWWDLASGRLRQAEGRGVTVAVAVAPAPGPSRADRLEPWLFVATTGFGAVALSWWAWLRVAAIRVERRRRWEASEPKAFRDLQEACRGGDARAAYRAFETWRRRAEPSVVTGPFAEEIEAAVFASAPWSPDQAQAFAERLEKLRETRRRAPPQVSLPPLNPAVRRQGGASPASGVRAV